MLIDRFLFGGELEDHEEMIYVIHRHWILVYKQFVKVVLLGLLVPAAILFLFTGFQSTSSILMYCWIGIGLLVLLYDFVDWYGDAWVLTNIRIIDVKWDGLFRHSGVTMDFYNMMDVEYDVRGIKQKLWKYGTLAVNKYSASPIEVEYVNKPKEAANMISKLRMQYMGDYRGERSEEITDVLAGLIQDRMSRDRKYHEDDEKKIEDRYS